MLESEIEVNIKKSIMNIYKESPILLLGGARKWFYDKKKDGIIQLSSIDSVNNFVEVHSNKKYKTPLVIDVFFSSFQAENGLLKFIEESKTPIVILSQDDTLSPIMMSRFKAVYKYPVRKPQNRFLSIKQAQEELEQPNPVWDDETRISMLSPKLYQLRGLTNNKRIQELLGDYYDRFNR